MRKIAVAISAFAILISTAATPEVPVNLIWLDDFSTDEDAPHLAEAVHHWVDTGAVNVLMIGVDSSNEYAAPMMKAFNAYFGHDIPISTYKGVIGNSGSPYTQKIASQFDPGDTSANYPNCVVGLRRALAWAANHSVKIAATGFATCLAGLMRSGPDGVSPLTGAQLIQEKVLELDRMGGDYPQSAGCCGNTGTEWNFKTDPADEAYVAAIWTSQHGYPPIYYVGASIEFATGSGGLPASFTDSNPAYYGVGAIKRPFWDDLTVYAAIFGRSMFTVSANGTNTVDEKTGANIWSSATMSGHYYVTASSTHPAADYEALFDGQRYAGAFSFLPTKSRGANR